MTRRLNAALAAVALAAAGGLFVGVEFAVGQDVNSWKQVGKLPDDFKVERVLLTGPTTGVAAGHVPGNPPADADQLTRRQAARAIILRSTDGGTTFQTALETQGKVLAIDFLDDRQGWVVVARPRTDAPGSLYYLFRSGDGGGAWIESGPIVAKSVTQVVQSAPDRGWVLGADVLMRTTDAGKTWNEVKAPGARNPVKERMTGAGPDGLMIAGEGGLLVTRDGGSTWAKIESGGRVHVARGDALVADQGKPAVFFARLQDGAIARGAPLPPDILAEQILVDGATVRIVATSFAKGGMELEFFLLTSTDGGATFRRETLPVTSPNAVGLFGAQAGWVVTLDRRVLAGP